jgi:flagellar biosynthesis/type III secretory pathway protein FliH
MMYERGYNKVDILELFRVIDWILRLPAALETEFLLELNTFEKAQQMPYIISVERIGIQKGLEQGRELGREEGIRLGEASIFQRLVDLKFGTMDDATSQRIQSASQEDLERWSERILTAGSLEELLA